MTPKQSHVFDWDKIEEEDETAEETEGEKEDQKKDSTGKNTKENHITFLSDATSKTTVIVKFKGAIDLGINTFFP